MNSLLKINNSAYFWALCLICGLFAFAMRYFLFTDQLYYATLGEQYTTAQIQKILAFQNETWRQAISYGIVPVIIIVRVLYTSFCLYIGNLVNESHWKFQSIYTISLKADVVFCFSQIVSFYYYAFVHPVKSLEDFSVNFVSLLNVVGKENIPNWLILAYNSINLFELFYVVLLVLMIKTVFKITYWKSIVFVVCTYCVGNYFYVTGMTFLYLNFT